MRSIASIKYWPVWLAVGVVWLLIQLPYRWQLQLGRQLGMIAFHLAKRARRIATINLAQCFPHLSVAERKKLLCASFMNLGIGTLETAFGWWAKPERLQHLYHTEGLAHIQQVQQQGDGVLICVPHMACLHLVGRLMNFAHPFAVMFFPPKNPVLHWLSARALKRHYQQAIPRHKSQYLLKALKQKMAVIYTPDTDAGLRYSEFVPFFGIMAATLKTTARFTRISKCKVIIADYWRRDDGTGYQIHLSAPLENYPSDDPVADALLINQKLEDSITAHPEQYLWQYKRFKTRPSGEAKFYGNL